MEISTILRMYAKEQDLLKTGRFGQGLWPVDMSIGQFMEYVIRFYGLKRGIEVGAGVGMSTGWLVSGFLVTGGKLTSFEYFPPKVEQWEKNFKKYLDVGAQNFEPVQLVPADMAKWLKHAGREKFDFVFFDQRKSNYFQHLQLILPKLKKGAIICADNVLSHPEPCQDYLDFVRTNKHFESVCLEIGAGLEVSRYLGGLVY